MNILVTGGAGYIGSHTVVELLANLAKGHLKALNAIQANEEANVWNLGTGQGHSVIEVINAFEKASGKTIPYEISPRRDGAVFSREVIEAVGAGMHGFVSRLVAEYPELDFDVWRGPTL